MEYGSIIHSSMTYLALDTQLPWEAMLAEARGIRARFVPHREREQGTKGWYSVVLHGLGEQCTLGHEDYGLSAEEQEHHFHWTSVADACPITTRYFRETFPIQKYGRIRFMLLEARGVVPFHNDYVERKLASVSVALNHPQGFAFRFRVGERVEEVPFRPGAAFALNLSYPHSVVNDSDEDRYHIIAHPLRSTGAYRELICRSYAKSGGHLDGVQRPPEARSTAEARS